MWTWRTSLKFPESRPSSPRRSRGELGLDEGSTLLRSPPSPHPPTVGLILKATLCITCRICKVFQSVWWLNLYFSHRDCLYFDFLTCSLYFSSIVADLDLWWLDTLYPKVQISMKTLSKALTIQTKQDKQSYLMFCPCGKCLLEAIFFIGPCIALIKGKTRNGKLFLYLYLYL